MTAIWATRKWWGLKSRARTRYAPLRHRRLTLGPNARIIGRLKIHGPGMVTINARTRVESATIYTVSQDASVVIGADCYINGPTITAVSPVTIGDRCTVANATIFSSDFHPIERGTSQGTIRDGPVTIGDDVWLCANVTVLRDVTIGPRTIVGVGVVISKDVPGDSLLRQAEPRVTAL